jgi:hypothetical protein
LSPPILQLSTPTDLAGAPSASQSGSHYSTIQAFEQHIAPDKIRLSFEEGMLFRRMEAFLDGKSQAAALFSGLLFCRAARFSQNNRRHLHNCGDD